MVICSSSNRKLEQTFSQECVKESVLLPLTSAIQGGGAEVLVGQLYMAILVLIGMATYFNLQSANRKVSFPFKE